MKRAALAVLLLGPVFANHVAAADDTVAFIADVEGQWNLQGASAPIARQWVALTETSEFYPADPTKGAIRIANRHGVLVVDLQCTSAHPCLRGYSMPVAVRGNSAVEGIGSFFRAIFDRLYGEPKKYECPSLKGDTATEVLLTAKNGQVDLRPALASWSTPVGRVRLVAIDPCSKSPCAEQTLTAAQVRAAHLAPGLYELYPLDERGQLTEPGTDAWVAVVAAKDVAKVQASWDEATALARGLPSSRAGVDLRRTFLRAALVTLTEKRP